MKCFNEKEIKAIKTALKCELRKNKKSSILEDEILEKVEYFKCPTKTLHVSEMSKFPLSERIKYAKMLNK